MKVDLVAGRWPVSQEQRVNFWLGAVHCPDNLPGLNTALFLTDILKINI